MHVVGKFAGAVAGAVVIGFLSAGLASADNSTGNSVGASAGSGGAARMAWSGTDQPRNPICGPHPTGFAGFYCIWDESQDGQAVDGPRRPVEREPATR